MKLRAWLLLLIWLSVPNTAHAQLDPEVDKPYRLQVVLHVADNRFLTPLFQEQLLGGLRNRLQLALGALAKVEVVTTHPLLAEVEAKGLESGLDGWEQISGLKTHFVLVDFAAGTYTLRARQHDGMTGLLSPGVRLARTNDRDQVAATAARLVEQDFGLVGTVVSTGKEVQLALRGAKLVTDLERWVKPGDVFAISRITQEGAKVRGTRVPWALLEVNAAPQDGSCRCRLWRRFQQDDLRDLPGVLGYRCLKLATTPGPLKLRLLDEQLTPLDGVQVHVLKPGATKAAELTTNRDGLLVTRASYANFVWVRVLSGDTVRAQFPVSLTDGQTVVCRLPALPDADAQTALEFRKDQWLRRILDDLRLAAERVGDLNAALGKSMDAALATARAGLQAMTSEVDHLTIEHDQIRRQAEEKMAKLDLRDGELSLDALRKKREDLERFCARIEAALKESTSPATLSLAKTLERARLLEGEADFDEAIALYKKILEVSPGQGKVHEHLAHLERAWKIKSPKHAEARAFLLQIWPKLGVLELNKNLAKAETALAVCREAQDRLTPLKVMQATAIHAAHLKKQLDKVSRQDSAGNLAQRKAIAKVAEGLRRLHAEATAMRGEGRGARGE